MKDDSKHAEKIEENHGQGQEPCPVCIRLIAEYRNAGLKIPAYVCCAFGHRLADGPDIRPAPERLPVWAWTAPLPKGA